MSRSLSASCESARMCTPFIQSSFWWSKTAGAACTRSSEKSPDELVEREQLALAVEAPAEQSEVVDDRLRQVSRVAELLDRGRPVALREALTVRPEDHREVREARDLGADRPIDVDLARVDGSRSSPRMTCVMPIAASSSGFTRL